MDNLDNIIEDAKWRIARLYVESLRRTRPRPANRRWLQGILCGIKLAYMQLPGTTESEFEKKVEEINQK